MSNVKCQMTNIKYRTIGLNFCWSVPPEFLRSFFSTTGERATSFIRFTWTRIASFTRSTNFNEIISFSCIPRNDCQCCGEGGMRKIMMMPNMKSLPKKSKNSVHFAANERWRISQIVKYVRFLRIVKWVFPFSLTDYISNLANPRKSNKTILALMTVTTLTVSTNLKSLLIPWRGQPSSLAV